MKDIPQAPPRRTWPEDASTASDEQPGSPHEMSESHKRAFQETIAYKALLQKKIKDYNLLISPSSSSSEDDYEEDMLKAAEEGKKQANVPPPKARRGKASVAIIDLRKNIELRRKRKEQKRRDRFGIIKKGWCSRKQFVDEIDLDDRSVFDPLSLERGVYRAKRLPKDYEIDRRMLIAPAYTGMFRDGVRRADYVVVLSAGGDDLYADELKVNFLSTCVKVGFDLEIERGVLPENNNLLFVKVHATDEVLFDYKDHFEVSRNFDDSHVEHVGKVGVDPVLMDRIKPKHEREWMKITRRRWFRPLKLSNRDRSYITYQILSHQPFGHRDKFYGLFRLLEKQIVIDAYALHDGPYFITAQQPLYNCNARQMLFMNWAGYSNTFSTQPLSLIQDYYGPRLAMYFAFYQFYLKVLLWAIPISILMFLPGWRSLKGLFLDEPSNMYCHSDKFAIKTLCPSCQNFIACPIRNMSDYCEVHKFVRFTQRLMTMSPIFSGFCIFIFFAWQRKQNYYRWLWEIRPKPRHPLVRVDYHVKYRTAKRTKLTGIWKMRPTLRMMILWGVLPILGILSIMLTLYITFVTFYLNIRMLVNTSVLMKYIIVNDTKKLKYRDYYAMGMVVPMQCVVMTVLERLFHAFCPLICRWENHRYFKNYERSLTYRFYTYTLMLNMPMLVFIYWLKGRFFAHPLEYWTLKFVISIRWIVWNVTIPYLGDILYWHCNKTINCIDEMVFCFVICMFCGCIFHSLRTHFRLFPYLFIWTQTDYNNPRDRDFEAPEWEREMRLKTLTEEEVLKWLNWIVVELTLYMWFGSIVPYFAVVLYAFNLVLVRKTAKMLVRYYRRPMLANARGLNTYNKLINFGCLAAPIAHAFTNTRMDLFWKSAFQTKNYSIVRQAKTQYRIMPDKYKTFQCLYTTKYRYYFPLVERTLPWPYHWYNISNNVTKLVASANRYVVEMNSTLDMFKYTHIFIIIMIMCILFIPYKSKFVADHSFKEDEIKRYARNEEFIFDDDNVGDIMR